MPSQAIEDYLKAIYKIQTRSDRVGTKEIAEALEVSSASVTKMIKRLAKKDFVEHTSYLGVKLTSQGEKIALHIVRRHRLLELYLIQELNYTWDQVHDEAEEMEHYISKTFEEKIAERLGYPQFDPHGHPIPTRDGKILEIDAAPLARCEVGEKLTIRLVSDSDPEVLRYLAEKGLRPQVELEVVGKEPFNGPLTIEVGGETHILGHQVAGDVFVTPTEEVKKERSSGADKKVRRSPFFRLV